MKVCIFGLGYVGFTSACCISGQGHHVVGFDVNPRKVAEILSGVAPITEPRVEAMLTDALAAGRITADTAIGSHLDDADLAIVCVGTPSAADGSHNMGFIADVTLQIANALTPGRAKPLVVAFRSTFRPGTMEELVAPIFAQTLGDAAEGLVQLVYNPEFLREGSAVADFFAPPKIVVGTRDRKPNPVMEALNKGIEARTFHVGFREAEMTKFVDNSWHAVKVGFANEIGRVCLALGVSARQVHEIFVSDTKLNISPYYLRPGGPFGGSCLPKDVRALQSIAAEAGVSIQLIESLLRTNDTHKHRLFALATEGLKPGAPLLLAGLAFKAGTDDLRESPNVDLARKLLAAGFNLEIYDPSIDASKLVGVNLGYAYSQLPVLGRLLVDKTRAETARYDRVIASNATIELLTLDDPAVVLNIGTLN